MRVSLKWSWKDCVIGVFWLKSWKATCPHGKPVYSEDLIALLGTLPPRTKCRRVLEMWAFPLPCVCVRVEIPLSQGGMRLGP